MTYAYLCGLCRHLSSEHKLRKTAPTVHGPYDCLRCVCEVTQADPVEELSRAQYEAFVARQDDAAVDS